MEPLEDRRMLSITVDTLVDENNGVGVGLGTSLREAIAAAVPGDMIDFSVTGTINLTLGILTIDRSLTLNGPGAELLTLRAYDPTPTQDNGDGTGVLQISDGDDASLSDVVIKGLAITGGDTTDFAGGIYTTENLEIWDCAIYDNVSLKEGYNSSGGVFSYSSESVPNSLTIRNSTIDGNSLPAGEGGGIRKRYGTLIIEDSTISNNTAWFAGGGISAADGNVSVQIRRSKIYNNRPKHPDFAGGGGLFALFADIMIIDSEISGNTAPSGGGIYANASTLSVTDTIFSTNAAMRGNGGALFFSGDAISVLRTTIVGNSATTAGGGIYYYTGSSMTVTDSTINGNTAYGGGGGILIAQQQVATIDNSTVSGNNSVIVRGGGIDNRGTTIVRFSTVTNNTATAGQGGGISSSGQTQLLSTIVADNTNDDLRAASSPADFESLGYNLVGTGSGVAAFSAAKGDLIGEAPLLGPLADNGGPTKTHALLPGSPAIDAGDPAAVAGMADVPLYDQRGAPLTRVFDGGGADGARIDIGALERQPIPPAVFGDYNGDGTTDAGDYVVWRRMLSTTGVPAFSGADGDGNGEIGAGDYSVWTAHFGETPEAGSATLELASVAIQNPEAQVSSMPSSVASDADVQTHILAEPARATSVAFRIGSPNIVATEPSRHVPLVSSTTALATHVHDDALVAWLSQTVAEKYRDDAPRVRGTIEWPGGTSDFSDDCLAAALELLSELA